MRAFLLTGIEFEIIFNEFMNYFELRKYTAQLPYFFVSINNNTVMEKEKISNNELRALGIEEVEILVNFSRVANGLLKHNVMDKAEILANVAALIDDPMPYALKKGGKFKNLAEDVITMRKEGKFVKQERSNF